MFFSAYTLGCKLNQLESEAIADSFRREGFSVCPADTLHLPAAGAPGSRLPLGPGIIMVNTCTVTSMAEQKARRMIRKLLRECPDACLVITGCYAQLDPASLAALEGASGGRLFVVPGEIKDRIMDMAAYLAGAGNAKNPASLSELISAWLFAQGGAAEKLAEKPAKKPVEAPVDVPLETPVEAPIEVPLETSVEIPVKLPVEVSAAYAAQALESGPPKNAVSSNSLDGAFRFRPEKFSFHSRGFIKIQDGCDRRCAYCQVRVARGKSRSLEAGEVLSCLLSMEERLIPEAVLTGVNICQYRSLEGGRLMGLPGLLDFLLDGTRQIRLRLSSIEPEELSADFMQAVSAQRVRPHFHLSVQSGSARILKKMGRPYTPADIENAVERLRSIRADPFLACDIIAGFPGESEEEFEKTLRLCENIGFAWIHAFPFSRRPGTDAYHFTERVSERDAAGRVELLLSLAIKGRREYLWRWEGKEVEAVVEAGRGAAPSCAAAVSENYLKLLVSFGRGTPPPPGTLIRCRVGKPAGKLALASRFDALAECV